MRSKVNTMAVYNTVKNYYVNTLQKFNPNVQVISKSSLIMTAPITTGTTNLTFQSNATSGGASPWEIRVQQTDTFSFYRLGVYAYGIQGTSTGPAGTTGNKYWTYVPTQMNSSFLAIAPLWDSGSIKMTLNGRQYQKSLSTSQCYEAPRTQDGPFQPLTTSGASNNAYISSQCQGDAGMMDIEPFITLSGAWNNEISIILPYGISPISNFAYVGDANDIYFSINYVNIVLEGLLVQNSSSILPADFSM